jgi:hypothetical protein
LDNAAGQILPNPIFVSFGGVLDPHDAEFLATYYELVALGIRRVPPSAPRGSKRDGRRFAELVDTVAAAEIATLRSAAEERRALAGIESGAFQQATARIRDDSSPAVVLVELEILDLTVAPVSEETLWYARVLWTFEYKQCRRGRLDDRIPTSADVIDIW